MSFDRNESPEPGKQDEAVPNLSESVLPIPITGAAVLTKLAFDGADLQALASSYQERLVGSAADAGALLDISTIFQLAFNRETALEMQRSAIEAQRIYRVTGRRPPDFDGSVRITPQLHLLALVGPGDLMVNTPLEFILKDSPVTLDLLYLVPGKALPAEVPDHDVAFVAVSEPDDNAEILERLTAIVASWPRPVINDPRRILLLSRSRISELLRGLPRSLVPPTLRVTRERLAALGRDDRLETADGEALDYPLVVRPIGSHAGEKLAKIDSPEALAAYLSDDDALEYYVMPFVDYRRPDGLYCKYRIVFILGRPFLCHMAVSERWMIHYLNAGMTTSPAKRREEEEAMASFDDGFARRHDEALRALDERMGLDYFGIDCSETRDGRLLVFEVDVAMVIHDMDPPELFPYKGPQMRKVFAAFERMLVAKSREP